MEGEAAVTADPVPSEPLASPRARLTSEEGLGLQGGCCHHSSIAVMVSWVHVPRPSPQLCHLQYEKRVFFLHGVEKS